MGSTGSTALGTAVTCKNYRTGGGTQQLGAEVTAGCQGPWREMLVRERWQPPDSTLGTQKDFRTAEPAQRKADSTCAQGKEPEQPSAALCPFQRLCLLPLAEFLQMCRRYNV